MRLSVIFSFAFILALASQASAAVVGYTFSGVTTTNFVDPGPITTEFPVGTRWTARVEWETTSAPLVNTSTQAQYRLTLFTLTFEGTSGAWTTSALTDQASFTQNFQSGGSQHEIQFTTAWGPANHSNPVIADLAPYSINVILKDPTGTAIPSLTPAPTSLDFRDWSPLVANSQLKLYLNSIGNRYILGEIRSMVSIHAPEIEVEQPKGRALRDKGAIIRFTPVAVGKSGGPKVFAVKNTGSGPLTGLSIQKSGPARNDFQVSPILRKSLPAGAGTTFTVRFRPSAKGTRSALLKIRSNDEDEDPFEIPVSGVAR